MKMCGLHVSERNTFVFEALVHLVSLFFVPNYIFLFLHDKNQNLNFKEYKSIPCMYKNLQSAIIREFREQLMMLIVCVLSYLYRDQKIKFKIIIMQLTDVSS
jgi:hypothetical protein